MILLCLFVRLSVYLCLSCPFLFVCLRVSFVWVFVPVVLFVCLFVCVVVRLHEWGRAQMVSVNAVEMGGNAWVGRC